MARKQLKHQDQFHARLSQWVASQGFWFHLRHSAGSSAIGGNFAYHFFQFSIRIFIFLIFLSAVGFYYLVKRTEGDSFRNELRESVSRALGVSELAMGGDRRSQGRLEITRFAGEGGPDSFFEYIEVRNLSCRMGLLDGVIGKWDTGTIVINRLETRIRAGTDSPADSANIGRLIFRNFEDVVIRNIEIKDATIGWGHSQRTRGRVEKSQVSLQRVDNEWRIVLKGGEFSQNWLRGFQIHEIVAIGSPDGIHFEKAELLQKGGGTLDFSGTRIAAGHEPVLSGPVRLRAIQLEPLLPPTVATIIEGVISANLMLSGSTNTSTGVAMEGLIQLDEANTITVRDSIPLLRALSIIDQHRTYRRLDFNEGSFRMATRNGTLEISDIFMRSGDLATMRGSFNARPPSKAELDAMMVVTPQGDTGGASIVGTAIAEYGDLRIDMEEIERQFNRRQASRAVREDANLLTSASDALIFNRIDDNYEIRMLAEQHAARIARMVIYEGELQLSLPFNAFDRTEALREAFAPDSESGRVPLVVPLDGPLHEITRKQSEKIYELGRH